MDKVTIMQLMNELENLTSNMDIPFGRRKDFRWLLRNADINNHNHKNLAKVIKICQLLSTEIKGE